MLGFEIDYAGAFHGGLDGVSVLGLEPPVGAEAGVAPHRHYFGHRDWESVVDLGRLHHVGDPVRARPTSGNLDRPGCRLDETGDRIQQGRLA